MILEHFGAFWSILQHFGIKMLQCGCKLIQNASYALENGPECFKKALN